MSVPKLDCRNDVPGRHREQHEGRVADSRNVGRNPRRKDCAERETYDDVRARPDASASEGSLAVQIRTEGLQAVDKRDNGIFALFRSGRWGMRNRKRAERSGVIGGSGRVDSAPPDAQLPERCRGHCRRAPQCSARDFRAGVARHHPTQGPLVKPFHGCVAADWPTPAFSVVRRGPRRRASQDSRWPRPRSRRASIDRSSENRRCVARNMEATTGLRKPLALLSD